MRAGMTPVAVWYPIALPCSLTPICLKTNSSWYRISPVSMPVS
jgi:hypothetical protein